MSTLIELRTQLTEDYTRDPNNRVWTSSTVDRAINKGYKKVQKDLGRSTMVFGKDTTYSTVIGVGATALPSDFVSVVSVVYDNRPLSETKKEDTYADRDNAKPESYYLYQNNIVLYPAPDSVYSIQLIYDGDLSQITVDQDSVLPSDMDDAICVYSAYKLFLGAQSQQSTILYQEYQEQMNDLRMKYQYIDQQDTFGNNRRRMI